MRATGTSLGGVGCKIHSGSGATDCHREYQLAFGHLPNSRISLRHLARSIMDEFYCLAVVAMANLTVYSIGEF